MYEFALWLQEFIKQFQPLFDVAGRFFSIIMVAITGIVAYRVGVQNRQMKKNLKTLSDSLKTLSDKQKQLVPAIGALGEKQTELRSTVQTMVEGAKNSATDIRNAAERVNAISASATGTLKSTAADFSVRFADMVKDIENAAKQAESRIKQTAAGDVVEAQIETTDGVDPWEAIRESWADARQDVRLMVDAIFNTERDGRRLRPLDGLDYRNYSTVAEKLHKGGWATDEARDALQLMSMKFTALRSWPGNATVDDAQEMATWNAIFKSHAKRWIEYAEEAMAQA